MVSMEPQKIIRAKQNFLKLLKFSKNADWQYLPQMVDKGIRKKKGIYYTPKEITSYICFQTISSYVFDHLKEESPNGNPNLEQIPQPELEKLLQHLAKVKILDPACGAGVFLIEAAEILFQIQKFIFTRLEKPVNDYNLKRNILLNNIYGVDLFPDAIKDTKTQLLHWLSLQSTANYDSQLISCLDWNLRVGNSLIGWLHEDLGVSIEFYGIYTRDLELKFQNLLNSSPNVKLQIQSTIRLLQSKDWNDILTAFFQLKQIQKENIAASADNLKIILQELYDKIYQIINFLFDQKVFAKKQKKFLQTDFVKHQPLHWKVDFGEIIRDGGFDIIIGNPPYVFIRGKNFSAFEDSFYKTKYLRNFESLAKGKAKQSGKLNSFILFIIRSIELLKQDHHMGFIIPNTLLRTTTNDFIRQFILTHTFIQEIVDLKGDMFKDVTASTILLFLQKATSHMNNLTLINCNVTDLLNYQFDSHFINQNQFYNNPVFAFNIHLDTEFEQAFEVMKLDTIALGFLAKAIIEGIVCRESDHLFTDDPAHPLAKKLLRGKNIGRYKINWKPWQYIIYAIDTSLTPNKLHRPRPQWVHEAPEKLLTQRIGGGIYPLQVAYDNSQYYTFASINNIIFKQPLIYNNTEFLSKYILAILNSKLMNAYYLLNYSNKSALTVNISKTYLESLPIKKVSPKIQMLISNLVNSLLFLYQFYKNEPALIEFFDFYLLDSVIYEIYFPTQLETNLCDLMANYLLPLPPAVSPEENFKSLLTLMQNLQNNLLLNQIVTKIQNSSIIQRIENLFQKRVNLLQKR